MTGWGSLTWLLSSSADGCGHWTFLRSNFKGGPDINDGKRFHPKVTWIPWCLSNTEIYGNWSLQRARVQMHKSVVSENADRIRWPMSIPNRSYPGGWEKVSPGSSNTAGKINSSQGRHYSCATKEKRLRHREKGIIPVQGTSIWEMRRCKGKGR